MKKVFVAGLIVVASSLWLASWTEAASRHHHGHHRPATHARVFVCVGPAVWWGPYPYWYYPPPAVIYAPPPPPPVIIQEQPPVYIQQAPPAATQAPSVAVQPPAPPTAAENFWYFCASAKAYYPTVPSFPEAWVKVAPRPQ